ncbi:helix-turn-helix domain-containing protein [Alistipes sp. OttesenSCG-928-B03]|nr:helix-turn-helix domain-containing protein [Alistipes sp. OttesenSCG-928-B03]
MKERLVEFMKAEDLTASKLAEVLNVQPSAISHLLGGRNKPGFDFLAVLFSRFPRLNARWFMLGEGNMYAIMDDSTTAISLPPEQISNNLSQQSSSALPISTSNQYGDSAQADLFSELTNPTSQKEKYIEKMIFVYSDKTFSVHYSEK